MSLALDNLTHISFTGTDPAVRRQRSVAPLRPAGAMKPPVAAGVDKPALARAMDEGVLDPLMAWMLERAGLQPAAYRPAAMQRRVTACLRQLRVASADSAKALIEARPELLPFALNTVLIGVSEFFRDRPVFDYLKATVLPELAQRPGVLRVCSVGASGGQELYSVAMLLAEAGLLERSELIGVDCRADAIRRARAGVYGSDDLGGVETARRERFFQPVDSRWAVRAELRQPVRWQVADLLAFKADGPCDLILFRNVAIYFNETHSAEAWERLCAQLAPGGFLVTGKAEKPPASPGLTRVAPSIYRKNLI